MQSFMSFMKSMSFSFYFAHAEGFIVIKIKPRLCHIHSTANNVLDVHLVHVLDLCTWCPGGTCLRSHFLQGLWSKEYIGCVGKVI